MYIRGSESRRVFTTGIMTGVRNQPYIYVVRSRSGVSRAVLMPRANPIKRLRHTNGWRTPCARHSRWQTKHTRAADRDISFFPFRASSITFFIFVSALRRVLSG